MSQFSGYVFNAFTLGSNPPATKKFKNFDVSSENGYNMLFTPDSTNPLFEHSLFMTASNLEYSLEVSDNGMKAKVTARLSGNLKFGMEGSGGCCHNATGTYTYENEFEFDLSDENEAKLTVAHLSQKLGVPEPDKPAELYRRAGNGKDSRGVGKKEFGRGK